LVAVTSAATNRITAVHLLAVDEDVGGAWLSIGRAMKNRAKMYCCRQLPFGALQGQSAYNGLIRYPQSFLWDSALCEKRRVADQNLSRNRLLLHCHTMN